MVVDGPAAIGAYLAQTRAVHVVRVGLDGGIQILNAAMAAQLGLPETLEEAERQQEREAR